MQQLFMVCLGGKVTGCNIEMHDIRFVVGDTIESTFTTLKQQWCGDKANVHMDSYLSVRHVDGYAISIENTPQQHEMKLYFVNLGAYYPNHIMEQHSFDLIVAKNEEDAKNIAKSRASAELDKVHKDRLMEVDDVLQVSLIDNHYIHLTPSNKNQQLVPDWYGYHVLS